jgi:hypothetical protein
MIKAKTDVCNRPECGEEIHIEYNFLVSRRLHSGKPLVPEVPDITDVTVLRRTIKGTKLEH